MVKVFNSVQIQDFCDATLHQWVTISENFDRTQYLHLDHQAVQEEGCNPSQHQELFTQ